MKLKAPEDVVAELEAISKRLDVAYICSLEDVRREFNKFRDIERYVSSKLTEYSNWEGSNRATELQIALRRTGTWVNLVVALAKNRTQAACQPSAPYHS